MNIIWINNFLMKCNLKNDFIWNSFSFLLIFHRNLFACKWSGSHNLMKRVVYGYNTALHDISFTLNLRSKIISLITVPRNIEFQILAFTFVNMCQITSCNKLIWNLKFWIQVWIAILFKPTAQKLCYQFLALMFYNQNLTKYIYQKALSVYFFKCSHKVLRYLNFKSNLVFDGSVSESWI